MAVAKPSGVASAHFQGGQETLDRAVKSYLKQKYNKPGQVFLGIVHRLDRPVSGVMLFAKTSKAAARLSEQFRAGSVEKIYWAVVESRLDAPCRDLACWLRKDRQRGCVEVVEPNTPGAQAASLSYRVCRQTDSLSWLEIRPQTGRTHQVRVQLAHAGHPIYGDAKYGSFQRFGRAIALHARSLRFAHPVRREPIELLAELPSLWTKCFEGLFPTVRR